MEAEAWTSLLQAENEAFKKAGITEGTVTYICPKCAGEAIANKACHF